ncbi:hypothetical protein AB0P02_25865 [Streptomyces griseoluteus]|uniref:hypothetical protein n=1 Tax=Streptomyces griseoluteus TaxID=29306 RepID=UPI003426AA61
MNYPASKNGLDYLVDVVASLATDAGEYAVPHLQTGVEVLLKVRLHNEHWSLLFKKIEDASAAKFASGDFVSCTIDDALSRLKKIAGLPLSDKDVAAIRQVVRTRNALTHYCLIAEAAAVEARAADVLNFLLPFITEHLLPGLDKVQAADTEQTLAVVRAHLRGIESLLKTRMDDLRPGLKDVTATTVVCPECAQQALVLTGDGPSCRFCLKSWDVPAEAAAEFAWIVLGLDGAPAPGEEENAPVRNCPQSARIRLPGDRRRQNVAGHPSRLNVVSPPGAMVTCALHTGSSPRSSHRQRMLPSTMGILCMGSILCRRRAGSQLSLPKPRCSARAGKTRAGSNGRSRGS